MTAYLNGFDYDIFISYGWAGAQEPDEGDRAGSEILRSASRPR